MHIGGEQIFVHVQSEDHSSRLIEYVGPMPPVPSHEISFASFSLVTSRIHDKIIVDDYEVVMPEGCMLRPVAHNANNKWIVVTPVCPVPPHLVGKDKDWLLLFPMNMREIQVDHQVLEFYTKEHDRPPLATLTVQPYMGEPGCRPALFCVVLGIELWEHFACALLENDVQRLCRQFQRKMKYVESCHLSALESALHEIEELKAEMTSQASLVASVKENRRAPRGSDMECGICEERDKDTTFLACGHCCCRTCSEDMLKKNNPFSCPFCKVDVAKCMHIFYDAEKK